MVLFRYIIQDILHDWGRSLLTVMTLAAVVAAYLILTALSQAYSRYGLAETSQFTNLMLLESTALDPMESSLDSNVLQAAESIKDQQVQKVSPMIFRHMSIDQRMMQVRAAPVEDMPTVYRLGLSQGSWPMNVDELVASEEVIQITNWKLGDVVRIYGSDFHLVGIVKASGSKFASLWMSLQAGEKLFGSGRGYQIIFIQLKPGSNAEDVRLAMETRFKALGRYGVYLENQVSDRYYQTTMNIRRLNLLELIVALLAATFGTFIATSLMLLERLREVAILRCVGFIPAVVRRFLFARILLQVIPAYLIGLGVVLIYVHNKQTFDPIVIQAETMPLSLPVWSIALGLVLTVCFAGLGVWLSTRHYFNTSAADQLRSWV
jgi:ABC-type antimicrobial peptide transport system permease subunit